jgi:histidine triad (HIT) family protein
MPEGQCIFCGIIQKQVPSKIVYEDEDTIAFLDVNPRSKGMTIVVPKQHFEDFDENIELALKTIQTSLIVEKKIEQALSPLSVSLAVMKSPAVLHYHVRVYPVYEKEIPLIENQPKKVEESELEEIAKKIMGAHVELKMPAAHTEHEHEHKPDDSEPEEKKPKIKLSKREVQHIKNEMNIA